MRLKALLGTKVQVLEINIAGRKKNMMKMTQQIVMVLKLIRKKENQKEKIHHVKGMVRKKVNMKRANIKKRKIMKNLPEWTLFKKKGQPYA